MSANRPHTILPPEKRTALHRQGQIKRNRQENFFFYEYDPGGCFTSVSPTVQTVLGFSQGEFLRHYTAFLTDNPVNKDVSRFIQSSISGQQLPPYLAELIHKDGSVRRLEIMESPVFGKDGRVISVKGLARGINDRIMHKEALQFEHRQLLSIFDSFDNEVYVCDPETHEILFINRKTRDAFGDIVGDICFEALQGLDSPCSFCTNQLIFGDNIYKPHVWEFQNKKNSRWYRCMDRAIHWPDGRDVRLEVAVDITQQKLAEEKLRLKNILLATQQETSLDGILVVDRERKKTSCNQRFIDLWGAAGQTSDLWRDEQELQSLLDRLKNPEEFLEKTQNLFDHHDETSRDEIALKDGRIYDRYSTPMIGCSGEYLGRVFYFRDITTQKTMESALRQSEELYRSLIENIQLGVSLIDENYTLVMTNSALSRMFDKAPGDLMGRKCFEFFYQSNTPCPDCPGAKAMSTGTSQIEEKNIFTDDGTVRSFTVKAFPVLSETGTAKGFVEVVEDVTEKRKADALLKANVERLRIVLEQTSQVVYDYDITTGDISWSGAVTPITGYSPDEIRNINIKAWGEHIHPEDHVRVMDTLQKCSNAGIHFTVEYRYRNKNGGYIFIEDNGVFLKNMKGLSIRMIGTMKDISERKHSEMLAERYTRRLTTLHEISLAILEARSPRSISQAALDRFQQIVPCTTSLVSLFDFKHRKYDHLAASPAAKNIPFSLEELPYPSDHFFQPLLEGSSFRVDDTRALKKITPNLRMFKNSGIRSLLAIPLMVEGRLMGSLSLFDIHPNAFDSECERITHEVAAPLAIAIHSTKLLESTIEQQKHLRKLAARLTEAEETERNRLARLLHDDIGQSISALSINLNIFSADKAFTQNSKLAARLEDSLELAAQMSEQVRNIMADLRPPVIDDYGLMSAIHWYGKKFEARTGLFVTIHGKALSPRLEPTIELSLFRILQEAMTNAAKHSQAKNVIISLLKTGKTVRLTIEDDGTGFNPVLLQGGESLGMVTMKERALTFCGKFSLDSSPGKGTKITVEVRL